MTNEKAKDFFSAYYEGTLEPGLCVSFEQKLKSDRELRSDYEGFVRAVSSLDVLKLEEVEIPEDLHETISSRLDRHIYETKRAATPSFGAWVRGLAFAGLGAAAIGGAFVALNVTHGKTAQSGIVGAPAKDQINYQVTSEGLSLEYIPNSLETVVITNAGKELKRTTVGSVENPRLKTVLSNELPRASVFDVQVVGNVGSTFLVIPGQRTFAQKMGDGTILDFAKAVSDFYRVPVSIETSSPDEHVTWKLSSLDPVSEASKALGTSYSVTQVDNAVRGLNGVLEIEQK